MTEKTKKKKETTPACNGTQRTNYTPLGTLFFVPSRSANAKFKTPKGQPSDNSNSEGAVAMSASGDSPFTHRRLSRNQRFNLPLLAGGDCADWRLISVTPKGDHADHRAPFGSSNQRYQLSPPNR